MLIFKQANHMPIGFFENVNLYYISVFNKKTKQLAQRFCYELTYSDSIYSKTISY